MKMTLRVGLIWAVLLLVWPLLSGSAVSRWFVLSNTDGSCSSVDGQGYSLCMTSLDSALHNISRNVTVADNLTLVLARGVHVLTSPVVISGADGLTIVSEGEDRNNVIINATQGEDMVMTGDDTPSRNMITFLTSRRFQLSYVTVEMLREGTVFDFTGCHGVSVVHCGFINTFGRSTAMQFVNTATVEVISCSFQFDVTTVDEGDRMTVDERTVDAANANGLAVFSFLVDTALSTSVFDHQLVMTMTNCSFMPKSSYEEQVLTGYGHIGQHQTSKLLRDSLLQVIILGPSARGIDVNISDCYVQGLKNGMGVPVFLYIGTGASGNSITLTNSQIKDNKCISGCGVLVLFKKNAENNTITMSDVVFTNNEAVVEGGAIFALLEEIEEVDIGNILRVNRCTFYRNRADTFFGGGSAIMIYSNREVSELTDISETERESVAEIADCSFVDNVAERAALYSKDTDVTFTGNCKFVGNSGGAVFAYRSKVTFRGGKHNFTKNTGAIKGGAISLLAWSSLAFMKVESIHFVSNVASGFGGAIWADSTSSSEVYIELLNDFSKITTSARCFIERDESLPFDYGCSNPKAKIHFCKNRASLGGPDVYATTFRLCNISAIAPASLSVYGNSYPVATSPYLMTFECATCKCFKQVTAHSGDIQYKEGYIQYKEGQCNRSVVAGGIQAVPSTLRSKMKESLRCWKQSATSTFSGLFPSAGSSLYMPDSFVNKYMWVPFGTCVLSAYFTMGLNQSDSGYQDYLTCSAPVQPSSITLNPAPGEQFSLQLNSWDEFLQSAPTVASIRVTYHSIDLTVQPSALLRHSGTEYSWDDGVSFNPQRPINDLSLAGPVNASGYLFVSWPSYLRGFFCSVIIPFRLSECHPGFKTPAANSDKAKTSRYISDSQTRPVSEASSDMICTCQDLAGASCNKDGKTVEVKNDYWAGYIKSSDDTQHNELVTHQCVGHCKTEALATATTWVYDIENPDKHCTSFRTGVLCGTCKANYSETPNSKACQFCEDSWVSGLVGAVFFAFIGGIVLIALSMKFRLLQSEFTESWIFYIQTALLLVRPEQEYYFLTSTARSSVNIIHLGVGLCVVPHLEEVDRLFTIAIPSFYLLFLVFLLFVASYIRPLSKYIQRSEVLNTFLLVIIIVYGPLSEMACSLLGCSVVVGGDVRLFSDPNEICFGVDHLRYYIISVIVMFGFLLPLPALLVLGLRIKGKSARTGWFYRLAKRCANRYKDSREWWIAVTLWRRLFLTAVAAFLPLALELRQLILFILTLIVFFLSALVEPYKSRNANRYEFVLLANMCLLAALSINEPLDVSATKEVAFPLVLLFVLLWPNVSILVIAVYKNRHNLKRCYRWLKRKCHCLSSSTSDSHTEMTRSINRSRRSSSVAVVPDTLSKMEDKASGLRDPLLLSDSDDEFGDQL